MNSAVVDKQHNVITLSCRIDNDNH